MSSSTREPNRLINESSPYLIQHARNPVDWYPWGEEAFQKARAEDKPIFLSVGYSSCHWCHVMERESFEDAEIARLLNDGFVSIKVDREERPDVDAIYMTAVQLTTGSGGWPMSVFLDPDLKPFFAGTYFPPHSMYGRPGFKDVLTQIVKIYREERGKVAEVAGELTARLQSVGLEPEGSALPGPGVFDLAYRQLAHAFDSTFGGFGRAPKFPHAMDLSFLLRYWKRSGESLALDMAILTLEKMAEGGMYDQIGGGFHRYSVDERWLVPHFEKMLYDNGLLARAYLEGYQATGEEFFLRIAREVLDYAVREMQSPEGGFYSATDADSEGEEGKYFVWTPEEVEEVLGAEDARLFCLYYNITVGGNFEDGKSIPNVTRPVEEIARNLKIEPAAIERVLREGRAKLYAEREKRVKPGLDDKVLASWNGLMLSALARGCQATGEPRYREAALRAGRFIEENLIRDGLLYRTWKGGEARIPGFLDDYSYLAEAFIDLYEAVFEPRWLERARALAETLLEEFGDPAGGALFYSSERHRDLIHRRKDIFDSATPSGNWVAAGALLRLERLTGAASYRERAEDLLRGIGALIERAPMGFATALAALDFHHGPAREIAVIGDPDAAATRDVLAAIHRRFLPRKVLAAAAAKAPAELAGRIPLLEGKDRIGGKTTIYLCENFTCKAPITDLPALEAALDAGA